MRKDNIEVYISGISDNTDFNDGFEFKLKVSCHYCGKKRSKQLNVKKVGTVHTGCQDCNFQEPFLLTKLVHELFETLTKNHGVGSDQHTHSRFFDNKLFEKLPGYEPLY